jgi:hypothetical protein
VGLFQLRLVIASRLCFDIGLQLRREWTEGEVEMDEEDEGEEEYEVEVDQEEDEEGDDEDEEFGRTCSRLRKDISVSGGTTLTLLSVLLRPSASLSPPPAPLLSTPLSL